MAAGSFASYGIDSVDEDASSFWVLKGTLMKFAVDMPLARQKILADKTADVEFYMPAHCKFRAQENYKNARQASQCEFYKL